MAIVTWTGDGDGVNWSDGINWNGGIAPGAGDTVISSADAIISLNENTTVTDFHLETALFSVSAEFTTGGVTLLNGAHFRVQPGGTANIDHISISNSLLYNTGTVNLSGNGSVNATSGGILNLATVNLGGNANASYRTSGSDHALNITADSLITEVIITHGGSLKLNGLLDTVGDMSASGTDITFVINDLMGAGTPFIEAGGTVALENVDVVIDTEALMAIAEDNAIRLWTVGSGDITAFSAASVEITDQHADFSYIIGAETLSDTLDGVLLRTLNSGLDGGLATLNLAGEKARTVLSIDTGSGDGTLTGGGYLSGTTATFVDVDRLMLGSGHDVVTVTGGSGSLSARLGGGNDLVRGGSGNDIVFGNQGNDRLLGGAGNDTLRGDAGRDRLFGDGGDDILRGGSGRDVFVFATGDGEDVIADFRWRGRQSDKIDLDDVRAIKSWGDLVRNHMSQDGRDVVIDAGRDEIRILNTKLDKLDAGDFLF